MAKGFEFILASKFPHTAAVNHNDHPQLSKTEKLKDAAKKASDLAKSQANTMFASCEAEN